MNEREVDVCDVRFAVSRRRSNARKARRNCISKDDLVISDRFFYNWHEIYREMSSLN